MMRRLLLTLLLLAGFNAANAQDPQFSQFFANPLYLSPAFAGASEGHRVALGYRNQWPRIPNAFKTVIASWDAPFTFGARQMVPRHGLGVSMMADQAGAGVMTKVYATFNYSFLISLGRNYDHNIRLGVGAGIQQASIDFFRLRFPSQFDASGFRPDIAVAELQGLESATRLHEQVNAGMVYSNKAFYFGLNASNITMPRQTFIPGSAADSAQLPMRINSFAGLNIPLNSMKPDGPALSPAVMFRYQQPSMQVDLGMYVNFKPIVFGVWYHMIDNDALVFLIGVQEGNFSFGYSYDLTMSSLTNATSGGAHEVSVTLNFESSQPGRRRPSAKMSCPRF